MKRSAALVPIAAGALFSGLLSVAPASAVDPLPRPVDCPTALPTSQAVQGLHGTGWTVDSGTTPAPFSATVLGRVRNGIAPGVDLIMARLSSPAITEAGGVWAGMSGSPVYTADGKLIGAVAYGLAASSPVAGITPAADLERLLTSDPDAAARTRVRPAGAATRVLREAGVSQQQAARGFAHLPMPLSVSGATSPGAKKLVERLQRRTGERVTTGSAAATGTASPSTIAGGGNIAAAVAYGDATLAAVGTTTFTCGGRLVAFGHPFLGEGVTTYSAHTASAVYVQPDPVFGPFKVANTGGVVGVVDRDRDLGIRARLGAGPRGTAITSRLTRVETGAVRTGRTTAVYAPTAADAAAFHLLANVDKTMGSFASKGTARVMVTIKGHRAGGRAFSVRHGDVLTATDGLDALDFQVAFMAYDMVSAVQSQDFEDVTLDSVQITGSISSRAVPWTRAKVEVKQHGTWVSASRPVVAKAGSKLWTRTTLTQFRAPSVHSVVKVGLTVPRSAVHHSVALTVTGADGGEDFFGGLLTPATNSSGVESDVVLPASDGGPASLDDLLAQLASTPRQDSITAQLKNPSSDKVYATHTRRASTSLTGFSVALPASVS
jgi:hypothetical protein